MKNKEITIYELIRLIKDGKAPNKVYYKGSEYKFCNDIGDYRRLGWEHCLIIKDVFTFDSYSHNSLYNMLNDKVEILSEKNDEWEDIPIFKISDYEETFNQFQLDIVKQINLIKKNQKHLKVMVESLQRPFTDEIRVDTPKWIEDPKKK